MTHPQVSPGKRTRTGPTLRPIYIGDTVRRIGSTDVEGGFVSLFGERFYRIANYDRMPPFFMSIVSHSDHWMFISSNGALTAGRKNPDHALFPYYTVDKIHDSAGITGGKTLILAEGDDRVSLWEPFASEGEGVYRVERNLFKNGAGNKVLFEEVNQDLGLAFRMMWTTSEEFGFVKWSALQNMGDATHRCRLLDGLLNILPYGADSSTQTVRSTLLDAYKKSELLAESGLGLFLLSSMPVDKPEPSESLMATTVWSAGLEDARYLLCAHQLDHFRRGGSINTETDVRAERGAYFVSGEVQPGAGEEIAWVIVADVNQGPVEVANLRRKLRNPFDLRRRVEQDLEEGTARLRQLVAAADGLQLTNDELTTTRHFSNVLFNIMRGGTFANGYRIERRDLLDFIDTHNRGVAERHQRFLEGIPEIVDLKTLLTDASEQNDPDLSRLCHEYLPLIFSRRHGDPSRPWNNFSIDIRATDRSLVYNYEGNWRDIFQNWEALCISYPEFAQSIISKFVNASTPDGYNPYRITRDGIDWELLDPSDPWSFIGYWGDHQIIYLLKLLEISRSHHPGELERMLSTEEFAYANVPYRIKPYESLLEDPHDTIEFDERLENAIEERVREIGADGRLLRGRDGDIKRASLAEKILVSVLTKYSNLIPEGGIWMNTQRPEWNDANNALVGFGVSMVTLYYLRRFQVFARGLFESTPPDGFHIAEEVADFLADVTAALRENQQMLRDGIDDAGRRRVLDALGAAGTRYRERVYADGFTGVRRPVGRDLLLEFVDRSLEWTDHSIRANRRADGLYHSYNLMTVTGEGVSVSHLYEMLEGQVAVLSSGLLSPVESAEVLFALRDSALYRSDQYSYLLYPDRQLPRFVEKNIIPDDRVASSRLLTRLLGDGDTRLVVRDVDGLHHFNGTFSNSDGVARALDELAGTGYRDEVDLDRSLVLDLFEEVFDHRSYTGRSGTFFGYEGLGCIYWHMVSKLLLATGETYQRAVDEGADAETIGRLVDQYYSIRAGIGLNKSPAVFGAFPTDPYSHTPSNAGARQPGMTGQVKEDILARWIELGAVVRDGCLSFEPTLLRESELLSEAALFSYNDVKGVLTEVEVAAGELAFTYCQVPVIYSRASQAGVRVVLSDGVDVERGGRSLGVDLSREVLARTGRIRKIEVGLGPGATSRQVFH